jgi:hypothetical protein
MATLNLRNLAEFMLLIGRNAIKVVIVDLYFANFSVTIIIYKIWIHICEITILHKDF